MPIYFENINNTSPLLVPQDATYTCRSWFSSCRTINILFLHSDLSRAKSTDMLSKFKGKKYIESLMPIYFENINNTSPLLVPQDATYTCRSWFSSCRTINILFLHSDLSRAKSTDMLSKFKGKNVFLSF
eukprot:TRINITY_DN6784_c0_g1_i3.p1 TRINITY_DN6784_c0_g1~~TRINITY_DN6784_c0_g1_i3.p1  ORF type:complete len:129 (+),score=6.12 TRINITY_DN6784_c0_g1_i3:422-808(+)